MKQVVNRKNGESAARYDNLDGMRAYSAIAIVVMHVLANGNYGLTGYVFERIVPAFADLVFLFMVISGFSMCCGYYEKMLGGELDLGQFYAKRFAKAWPFFAVMCVLDFVMSPGLNNLCELLANLTLCFGLIPNADISVIGVGWFLGLVFVFYFLFPFLCGMLSNRKKAWLTFGVALLISGLTAWYFHAERTSFAYSGVFFVAGGMIYLYREQLSQFMDRFGWLAALLALGAVVLYFLLGTMMPTQLLVGILLTILALGKKNGLLNNPLTKRLSSISLEIYLCHMMAYRVLEKMKCTHLFSSQLLSFAVTAAATLLGAVLLSVIIKKTLKLLGAMLLKRKNKKASIQL